VDVWFALKGVGGVDVKRRNKILRLLTRGKMKSLKVGAITAVIVSLVIGVGLVTQDRTSFFTYYYTVAVPISITAGSLAFCISQVLNHRGSK